MGTLRASTNEYTIYNFLNFSLRLFVRAVKRVVGYLSDHSRISADCLPLFFSALSFNYVQLLLTFAASNPRRVRYLRANRCGWDDIYEKGVYLTLCLWRLENFATFQITVKGQGNGRCPLGYVSLTAGIVPAWQAQRLAYISAWASALLVLTGWAMRRPRVAGRVTVTDSRAFLYMYFSG